MIVAAAIPKPRAVARAAPLPLFLLLEVLVASRDVLIGWLVLRIANASEFERVLHASVKAKMEDFIFVAG